MKTLTPRKLTALLVLSLATVWLGGCKATTGTITHAVVSHFSFVGNTPGAVVTIDDQSAVALDDKNAQSILATEPGRHHVRVTKGERLVVDREVLVGDQQTMEISIP